MREMRNTYNILVGKSHGKRLLGRSRKRWETNIKINLREIDCGDIKYIEQFQVLQTAFVAMAINHQLQ
jgi:hypothetical protein